MNSLEVKKSGQLSSSKSEDTTMTATRAFDFIGEVKAELKRISWTSPEELIAYTKIVVGMTFFLGLGIYVVDLFIQSILSGIHLLFQW